MNTRRKLVIALGAGALTAPFRSFAQQQDKVWRVGFLSPGKIDDYRSGPFLQGMRELGYVQGKNLLIEWRSAEGNNERLSGLAKELVNLKVDVIAAVGTPGTSAAQKSTITMPIVMLSVADPIGNGLVKSLARPGGNTTGISNITGDLISKQLEILLAMAPKVARVAVLVHPTNLSHATMLKSVQAAARRVNVTILPVEARRPQEIETAFTMMARQNAGALIALLEPLFQQQKGQIVELTAKHRLPFIGGSSEYVEAGGLMSYGANTPDIFRRGATYVDKILKGAKPGDLPVEQPTKFEMFINGKTAKALGLTIPQSLLIMADKVI
jgi:putative ABC transport system substrate-binding protein